MKMAVLLPLLALLAPGRAQTPTGQPEQSCWAAALTQAAMNRCAVADLHRADDEMNRALRDLLARASAAHPTAVPKIKAAQAAWMAYAEAQTDAMYAAEEKQETYGTVYPMCVAMLHTKLVVQRTAELRAMMDLPEEGAACRGDRYPR